MFERLSVDSETLEGAVIVRFNDQKILDDGAIGSIATELDRIFDGHPGEALVVDCKNVSYMSSALWGKLIVFNRKAKAHDRQLFFSNVHPEIYEIAQLMGLPKVMDFCPDLQTVESRLAPKS